VHVLVTGFGPFPGAPVNPTMRLVAGLARSRHSALAGVRIVPHIFETSYAAVDRDLPKLLERHRPDIVLMFGLAAATPYLRVEQRARNARSIRSPDVSGAKPKNPIIAPGVSPRCGRAAFARLAKAARSSGLAARLSLDAGDYLCNYSYWRALEAASRPGTLVQFIHVPAIMRGPALLRAGEAILHTLVAARRR
jgi:pyroglutamyl-peptidase